MRNDHKGVTSSGTALVFYASGQNSKAPEARSNGKGGLLDRGYWRKQGLDLKGPFSSRTVATF